MLRKSTTDWLSLDEASRNGVLSPLYDCRCRNVWKEAEHPAFEDRPERVWGSTRALTGKHSYF